MPFNSLCWLSDTADKDILVKVRAGQGETAQPYPAEGQQQLFRLWNCFQRRFCLTFVPRRLAAALSASETVSEETIKWTRRKTSFWKLMTFNNKNYMRRTIILKGHKVSSIPSYKWIKKDKKNYDAILVTFWLFPILGQDEQGSFTGWQSPCLESVGSSRAQPVPTSKWHGFVWPRGHCCRRGEGVWTPTALTPQMRCFKVARVEIGLSSWLLALPFCNRRRLFSNFSLLSA